MKHFKRALSLFLALALVVSVGIFQSATPVAAVEGIEETQAPLSELLESGFLSVPALQKLGYDNVT